jgi:peptidoglycan-associated lipoprotein
MMRLVLGLVAALTIALTQAQPADACGVKLTVKAPKVKRVARSSNPSEVLLVGNAPKRLASQLSDSGHSVAVASSPDQAPKKNYKVVIVDPGMEDQARSQFPGARVVARSGSTRDNLRSVEEGVARRSTRTAAATPTDSSRGRAPTDVGPRTGRATPVATGGGETVAAAAVATEPRRSGGGETAPTPTPAPRREEAVATTTEPTRRSEEVPRKTRPVKATEPRDNAGDEPAERPSRSVRFHAEATFGGGSSDLSATARTRLAADARWLAANPGKTITIEGHASQVGSADVNQALSEARASAARDYLVEQGVDASRIQVVGFGFDRPAYQPASSARNRRIHIVVND